jgi:sulfate adenylyltransferase subunit 1
MSIHALPRSAGFEALLNRQQKKDVLRFITCGSVDDGKSTLIGRLLHDTKQLFDDQLAALERESRKNGSQRGTIDFALLLDGLAAEREQGITIDVAYRFFSTAKRTFIVADTPGHEQYTRNMATGASTADVAILLVDARKGPTQQTRRHSLIVSMLGIRRIVLAINKMDLVGWSQDRFDAIMVDYAPFATHLGFADVTGIPLSALNGDNVVHPAVAAPWYAGPTLLQVLEQIPVHERDRASAFRLPVQWVNRPNLDFRGYAGLIASGAISVGQRVRIFPSGRETSVARILTFDGDLPHAIAGQSVTLTLTDDVDVSRGDVIASVDEPPRVADRIDAQMFWVADGAVAPGARFHLKLGPASAIATVETIHHRIDPNTAALEQAAALRTNDIGLVSLSLDRPLAFDPYVQSRETGAFILIDRESSDTAGMGLIRSSSQALASDRSESSPGRRGFADALSRLAAKVGARARVGRYLPGLLAAPSMLFLASVAWGQAQLLNVSYDPTRELYREINQAFAQEWKKQTGETITIRTSHGGSGRQARSVIDGLNADVVTLALAGDIDQIARLTRKIPEDWQKRLPNNASPYTSTIVFVVRKGNPKGIRDWDDLAKPGVVVITPNPKTSGGARWNYLAAWGYALDKWKDEARAQDFAAAIYRNVPMLDTGARGSTTTFAQRGLGDVFISWENEAHLTLKEFGEDRFEIVAPSMSILAEPPVALVDGNVDAKGARKAAEAYLAFLYTPAAQAIMAKNFYRASRPEAAAQSDRDRLSKLRLFTIDDVFGGWAKAQKTHFDDGGVFDELMKASR